MILYWGKPILQGGGKAIFNIAICEDDFKQSEVIYNIINKYKGRKSDIRLLPRVYCKSSDLLACVESGVTFDLYLLDIIMPDLNGIELARKLRELSVDAPIVFMTSSADYALDAFRVSAAQYILKPIDETVVFSLLDKLIESFQRRAQDCLVVATQEDVVKIPRSSVIYVELSKRKLKVYLEDGNVLLSKTMRIPFSEAVAPLLSDQNFQSAHKSFVLNMARAKKLTSNAFVMENGDVLPIPRYKYAGAKNRYFSWLSSQGVGLLGGRLS